MALEKVQDEISRLLEKTETRVSSHQATRWVAQNTGLKTRQAASLVNQLVHSGQFCYVYDNGQSYLEKNVWSGIRLSKRIIIAPPRVTIPMENDDVVIRILPGAAFGDCRHPTTRLSVNAIDFALSQPTILSPQKTALDIGTGSGILAITAAMLGMDRVLATDIDPCARKEARDNIKENDLVNRITISDRPVDKIAERFNLIISNLRPPTLIRYANLITEKTKRNGLAVLSGVKQEEQETLLAVYNKTFDCLRKKNESGWCAMVLIKRG